MTMAYKYAVYMDRVEIPDPTIYIDPLTNINNGYFPDVSIYDFNTATNPVVPTVDGVYADCGFSQKVLFNRDLLPHILVLLQIDDLSSGFTPAPGLATNALDDALTMGLASNGGVELTPANALLLATHLFPAVNMDDQITGKRLAYSAPSLDVSIIKRDCTVANIPIV